MKRSVNQLLEEIDVKSHFLQDTRWCGRYGEFCHICCELAGARPLVIWMLQSNCASWNSRSTSRVAVHEPTT
jgi:hypothetical protein